MPFQYYKPIPSLTSAEISKFFRSVLIPHDPSRCWIWQAGVGYKRAFRIDGSQFPIVRVSYKLHYKEDPPECNIYRRCGNTLCINPDHFRLRSDYGRLSKALRKSPKKKSKRRGSILSPDYKPLKFR